MTLGAGFVLISERVPANSATVFVLSLPKRVPSVRPAGSPRVVPSIPVVLFTAAYQARRLIQNVRRALWQGRPGKGVKQV